MRIYILEDNYIHRNYILSRLSKIEAAQIYEFVSVKENELLSFYKKLDMLCIQKDDIFLIDVDLNLSWTGIDIAEKIRSINKDCFIIFISSELKYSMQVINRDILPFGYLSKQFKENDTLENQLQKKLDKIAKYIQKDIISGVKLLIRTRDEIEYIDLGEVNYIETIKGKRYSVNIHSSDVTQCVNKSFTYFRQNISNENFYKELKSYIINVSNIKSIDKTESYILFENLDILYLGKKSMRKLITFVDI
ncbi:LytTR family DNA-binding domain-containing protein [Enterococcus faecium]|uniref:LytR/AlgR family response regulator transcription factor n=1 Tax=Enterococcus faecium TaxID=1352 RepID=UPI000BEF5215|nr:LytTR family transcriptional regulator DNA-binding domain-containing protein [Enterococcus faecium]PEH49539.1 hypothetical protein CRM75_01930 [Enterococcus faecium]